MLSAENIEELEAQLRGRERALLDTSRARRERATQETFARIAGEAPDSGDASVADNVADMTSAVRERDQDELREVRSALDRIAEGSYGLCQQCGEPIELERLRALPTARYDMLHQQQKDREQGPTTTPTL